MSETLFQISSWQISGTMLLIASILSFLLLGFLLLMFMRANSQRQRQMLENTQMHAQGLEQRLADMMRNQGEVTGQVKAMSDNLATRQSELAQLVNTRLDSMGQRLNSSVSESSKGTQESLSKLQERLAVIDRAQTNITELSGQVVQLQQVLANKQTRGAFGEMRLEAIVKDALPPNAYAFQPTLSNGKKPDCIIYTPDDAPSLVIDAKFPLEAYNRLQEENSPQAKKEATANFRRDVSKHISDISERYLIKGETQDTAFMFVPSESVFAAINEQFEDLVRKAQIARVFIVSPTLLMLSVQVMQAILKDARMRDLAHTIQKEVALLRADTGRLDDRVNKLQSHFRLANKDIDEILTSTTKVIRRSQNIEELEVGEEPEALPQKTADILPLTRLAEEG